MMDDRFLRPTTIFCVLCAFALSPSEVNAQDASLQAPVAPAMPLGLDLDALKETRLFPLFSPIRRLPEPAEPVRTEEPVIVEVAPDPASPPPALKLVGVVNVDNSEIALLQDPATGETHRVQPGGLVQNWKMRIVGPQTVEFENGDARQRYNMFVP